MLKAYLTDHPFGFKGLLSSLLTPRRPNQCPGGKVGYPPLASELQMSLGRFHVLQLCQPAGFCTLSLLLPGVLTQIASPREYENTPQTNNPNLSSASKEWRRKNGSGFVGLGKEIKHGLTRHSTLRPIPLLRSGCRILHPGASVGVDSVDSVSI